MPTKKKKSALKQKQDHPFCSSGSLISNLPHQISSHHHHHLHCYHLLPTHHDSILLQSQISKTCTTLADQKYKWVVHLKSLSFLLSKVKNELVDTIYFTQEHRLSLSFYFFILGFSIFYSFINFVFGLRKKENGGMLNHEVQESKLCVVHCVNMVL